MSFADLGLSTKVLDAVTSAGYTIPTPIQAQAIPHVMQRRDVLGIAQTGTGKTAAFTLPMITLLEQGRARARMPRTLILEPTRELAAQVEENFIKYGVNNKLSVALLIGGMSFGDQDVKITRGVDVLIATPGRLLDHYERGKLLLTGIEILVIDEADRMLDMGFIPDIERITKLVPFTRQTLFFTATMPAEITRITEQFLHNPVRIEASRPATAAATITQRLVASHGKDFEKRETLRRLITDAVDFNTAIIFANRKTEVANLHRSLLRHNFKAVALHGDLDQRARMAALDAFKTGDANILVASDVAARGLDIPDVSHVFNYDVPFHADDYVHRIGRTGRAGRLGAAFSIVTRHDEKMVAAIEKLIGTTIEWHGTALSGLAPSQATADDDRGSGRGAGRGAGRATGRGSRETGRDREPSRERPPLRRSPRKDDDADQPQVEIRSLQTSLRKDPDKAVSAEARPERSQRPADRAERPAPHTSRALLNNHSDKPRNDEGARSDHGARRVQSRDDDGDHSVKGLGDHMPAFMLKPTRK
ncbi:MAG: DEAD/DEAH box helicase [Bosea sp. (in: a-proteobacteria)]